MALIFLAGSIHVVGAFSSAENDWSGVDLDRFEGVTPGSFSMLSDWVPQGPLSNWVANMIDVLSIDGYR
ncbi:MAG: hypothetical protein KJ042_03685, partial [Deltaproteobacteria bacterium]|nr:hypothetical protein [Deltaproteobacteria bacterium]